MDNEQGFSTQSDAGGRPHRDGEPARRRSFFVRHWRGELELGYSYWLCGALVSILWTAVVTLIGLLDTTAAPRLISFCLGASSPISLIISVWQIVAASGVRHRGGLTRATMLANVRRGRCWPKSR